VNLIVLAIAGAAGTLARYGFGLLITAWLRGVGSNTAVSNTAVSNTAVSEFPLGTLIINVLGSFVLSYVTTLALNGRLSPDLRLAIGTGFCGAFTTFSTFELEAHGLIAGGANLEAGLYVFGNLLLGFAAVLLGRWLAA
jgi:fluoride exporter